MVACHLQPWPPKCIHPGKAGTGADPEVYNFLRQGRGVELTLRSNNLLRHGSGAEQGACGELQRGLLSDLCTSPRPTTGSSLESPASVNAQA